MSEFKDNSKERKRASRIIMGAIKDVMANHPDWFTEEGTREVDGVPLLAGSITKRASGNIAAWIKSEYKNKSD